ncbi:hypothetical protein ZWY2020_015277 [Hordeum vulgare]|nr:hypothetical protein ZWY2020_015277 [Hordeum vulgare]
MRTSTASQNALKPRTVDRRPATPIDLRRESQEHAAETCRIVHGPCCAPTAPSASSVAPRPAAHLQPTAIPAATTRQIHAPAKQRSSARRRRSARTQGCVARLQLRAAASPRPGVIGASYAEHPATPAPAKRREGPPPPTPRRVCAATLVDGSEGRGGEDVAYGGLEFLSGERLIGGSEAGSGPNCAAAGFDGTFRLVVPGSGELVIFGSHAKKPFLVVGVVSDDGSKLKHKVDLKLKRSTLCHDIGVTLKYNIIIDIPLTIDIGRLTAGGQ